MRVLGCKLLAGPRCHSDHNWNAKLIVGHVPQSGGGVQNLVQRQKREVHGHDLYDRAHTGNGSPNACAGKTGF